MPRIRELAKELGVKVIATNDNHFTYKEDAKLQRTMMLLGMHKSWADPDVVGSFFEDDITSPNEQHRPISVM
jgi:DNA polymerase-3 subunit alpha